MGRPRKQTVENETKNPSTSNSANVFVQNEARRARFRKELNALEPSQVLEKVEFWTAVVKRAEEYTGEFLGNKEEHVAWCRQWLDLCKAVYAEKLGSIPKKRRVKK